MTILSNKLDLQTQSIKDFLQIFEICPKPILFWDTCALFDIMRFLSEEKGGNLGDLIEIKKIFQHIESSNIYSVSSDICIKEVDDHYKVAKSKMEEVIDNMNKVYLKCISLLNYLNKPSRKYTISKDLIQLELGKNLENILCAILKKTIFLNPSEQIAYNALRRVVQKDPPAGVKKKQEFKDCAIWETMLSLCKTIQYTLPSKVMANIFYTTNTSDFCYGNNFHSKLKQEGDYF